MSTNSEAIRLNLEFYRKQAKALLAAAQAGEQTAIARIGNASPKLHDAQLAIAREQGFPSWPKFRAFVMQSGLDFQGLAATFINAALSDGRRARDLLAKHPAVADAGFYAALVMGNRKRAEQDLTARPELAKGTGGPKNWEPLLYVCFSRFANGASGRAEDFVETARVLLRHGANPDAAHLPENLPDNPLSCLYGATGVNNNPALGLALLGAGANPNDNESLYHSTEHPDLECVKMLLRNGAKVEGTNALKHMLDREDLEGLKLLLEAGADVNEAGARGQTALHWALWRGRSVAIISTLIDAGANLNAVRKDGLTAYALAVKSGETEVAELLKARGANTELPVFADERLLPDFAMNHHVAAVRVLLDRGVDVNTRGDSGETALHWACWKGYADLVDLLLSRGASLNIEEDQFHALPTGWFTHGLRNCCSGAGEYPQVARLLIAAGANFSSRDLPTGNAEVDAVLREHGLTSS